MTFAPLARRDMVADREVAVHQMWGAFDAALGLCDADAPARMREAGALSAEHERLTDFRLQGGLKPLSLEGG